MNLVDQIKNKKVPIGQAITIGLIVAGYAFDRHRLQLKAEHQQKVFEAYLQGMQYQIASQQGAIGK